MSHPLQLECPQCGSALQAKDSSDQGKEVRCPKCHAIFQLQLLDRDDQAGLNRGTRVSTVIPARRRSPWLVALLAILVIGTAGGVAALFYKSRPNANTDTIDLTYLPPETNLVARVKVNELMSSAVLSDILSNPAVSAMETLMVSQSGIAPRQIESLTVGVVIKRNTGITLPGVMGPRTPPRPYAVLVLRSTLSLDPEHLAVTMLKGTPMTHSGKAYFKLPVPSSSGLDSCYFPESNVAVLALENDLKAVIDRGTTAVKIPEFDFVRTDQTFVVAAKSDVVDVNPLTPPVTTGANLQALETELKQNCLSAGLGVTVKDRIDLEVLVNCRDITGATKIKGALDLNIVDLKNLYKRQQNWLNLSGMTEVSELAENSLNSITVTQTDDQIKAEASIPKDLKAIISKYTAGLSPFMMPGGIPGPAVPALPGLMPR